MCKVDVKPGASILFKRALSGLRHFWQLKTLYKNEKLILFHLKSSFRFQDILIFGHV